MSTTITQAASHTGAARSQPSGPMLTQYRRRCLPGHDIPILT